MTELAALLLPLAFLAAVYGFVFRGGRPTFRPGLANARFRSVQGPLMATWLAMVAAAWGLLDLADAGHLPLAPSVW